MDIQATKVFRPTWYAMLKFVMRYTILPIGSFVLGYAIYAKGVDVGLILLCLVFSLLFFYATVIGCTTRIIITPMNVVSKNVFRERSAPIPAIRRVILRDGVPRSSIKVRYLLIETNVGKVGMGAIFSAEQQQDAANHILELIRNKYPQNYESVLQYSNNPELMVGNGSNTIEIIDGEEGRVFGLNRKSKVALLLPFVLIAFVLFVDIHSFFIFILTFMLMLPFCVSLFKKITITSNAVIRRTLWGSRSIPLGTIRSAKITPGFRSGFNLVIQTDQSRFILSGLYGPQLDEALACLFEQIRINYPQNYEMVRQSSLGVNLWHQ